MRTKWSIHRAANVTTSDLVTGDVFQFEGATSNGSLKSGIFLIYTDSTGRAKARGIQIGNCDVLLTVGIEPEPVSIAKSITVEWQ